MKPRMTLTESAQKSLDEVLAKYGEDQQRRLPILAAGEAITAVAVNLCRDELNRARDAFNGNEWKAARGQYADVKRSAEQVLISGTNPEEARSVIVSATLGEAACLLNLQELEGAERLLETVSAVGLDPAQRTAFARSLVALEHAHRAREVLDAATIDERTHMKWREASQLVELALGNVPDVVERSPSVLHRLSQHHLVSGDVEEAAALAFEALEETNVNPVLGSALLSNGMVALMRTVYEDDIKGDGVPVSKRAEYAQAISVRFKSLFRTGLPSSVRRNLLGFGLNYSGSLREHELLRWILSNSDEGERDQVETNELKVAFELAAGGDVGKALAVVPKQEHPWRGDLIRFRLLREAGQLDAAVDGLSGLVTAWPGRVPVHAALAEMLIEKRDFALALPHAEACHRGLPTDSMASLLARCLVELGDGHRALNVLANAVTTDHVLELRAHAADLAHDPRAPNFWSELLATDSSDTNAKLRLGVSLARAGDVEGAARHARELLENHLTALKRNDVATCGQLLLLARFLPKSDELIKTAAETLRTSFPDDDVAEFQRLILASGLGFPEGVAPIEYDRLARAGHLQALSLDDAADVIRRRTELSRAAHALYQAGCLSIETLCDVTGTRIAAMVEAWSDAAGKGTTPLRAAIVPGIAATDPVVAGRTYFCSGLELLLLQHSGALSHVQAVIGNGALVSFESTWSSLVNDAYYLEQTAQRDETQRLGTLLRKIATWANVRRIDEEAADERTVASRIGSAFVAVELTESGDIDALSLLLTLAGSALVSRAQLADAARILGREPAHATTRIDLKQPLLFQSGLLELFDTAGVLDAVIAACARVHVTGEAVAVLQSRFDGLERQGRAATLQRRCVEELRIGLRAGWFQLIQEPQTSTLPPLREDADSNNAELLTRSIRKLVAVKQLVAERSGWRRVVADSFGFDTLGHPQQWKMLAFKNDLEGREFVRRYWTPSKSEITLGRFVRSLVKSPQQPSTIRQLARLGFADALLPHDIVEMEDEFGRFDTGAAARVLDGVEASVGDPHARGVFCRTQVASVYAMAMWQLATPHPRHSTSAISPYHQLMDRLERLDERHATRLVEQAVFNLAVAALDDRKSSFVEDLSGTYSLVPESAAGRLWRELYKWEAGTARRESSFRRGLGHAWELFGDLIKDGPEAAVQWTPLTLANDILVEDKATDVSVPSPDAVVAILSALWKERPLRLKKLVFGSEKEELAVDLEELLAVAAHIAPAEGSDAWGSDGSSLSFPYAPKIGAAPITLSMPIEAVLLRMEADRAAKAASRLANAVGFRDGRLYRALVEFADHPDDPGRRKYLALSACGAPFRLVADDPRFVLSFGDRAATKHHGYPASVAELREMLSEPEQLFTGPPVGHPEHELPAEFNRRLEGGVWANRTDRYELVHFASRVPGRLPSTAARSMFAAESDDDLKEASEGLNRSQEMTVGSLAMAVAFAILTCSSERAADLKERMGTALADTLRREAVPSQSVCLAVVEASVLRAIGRVVSRFSPWGMPDIEHAWLTTRLYEWWMREVDTSEVVSMFSAEPDDEWHRLRLEVILNVVLDVLEAIVTSEQRVPILPPAVIESLKWVATAFADNPFRAAPRLSWLYWTRPQGCGWLASSILLWIDPRTFFEMRPEMRLALLEKLPRTNESAKANGLSYLPVVRALGRGAADLKEPELEVIHAWLAAAESGGLLDLWRAELLTGLLASTGDLSAAFQLRSLASRETLQTSRGELLGGYVEAIAAARSPDLYPTVIELVETLLALDQADAVARGLGFALRRWNKDPVRDLLEQLTTSSTATPEVTTAIMTALAESTSST